MLLDAIVPVILSGGCGARLSPLSDYNRPKQFLPLVSESSLFQDTVLRAQSLGLNNPIIVCGEHHHGLVIDHLKEIKHEAQRIILEPERKNTAPAIVAAALHAFENHDDPVLLILPSDHVIADIDTFQRQIDIAQKSAIKGYITTFGIVPRHAHTGYGYIKAGDEIAQGVQAIDCFVEKPDEDKAEAMIKDGGYLWNGGMFCAKASVILDAVKSYQPDLYAHVQAAMRRGAHAQIFTHLNKDEFKKCPSIAFDYAVMERTDKGAVVPLDAGWDDIGSWGALYAAPSTQNKPAVQRPWGHYKIIAQGDGYKTKAIHVNIGAQLSLQTHQHRAEHWVIISGTAKVRRGGEVLTLHAGQSVSIPIGTLHSLENIADTLLQVIEVQTGQHLCEHDITRFEDRYGRV